MSIENEKYVPPDRKLIDLIVELRMIRGQLGLALLQTGHKEELASQTSIHPERLNAYEEKLSELWEKIDRLRLEKIRLEQEIESFQSRDLPKVA